MTDKTRYEVYRKANTFFYDTVFAHTAEDALKEKINRITEEHSQSEYVEVLNYYEIINVETGNLEGVGTSDNFIPVETYEPKFDIEEHITKLIIEAETQNNNPTFFEGYTAALEEIKKYLTTNRNFF
jgi:hypothetical protein